MTEVASWEVTQTAHNISRLLKFYHALDAEVTIVRSGDGFATYINGVPVTFNFPTAAAAIRAGMYFRVGRAEGYRPDGWKPFRRAYLDVNAIGGREWTPDDATKFGTDSGGLRDGELIWS